MQRNDLFKAPSERTGELSDNKKGIYADVILLVVAAIWGGGFAAGKLALGSFTPTAIIAVRFCGSALLFGLLFHKKIRNGNRQVARAGCIIGTVQFLALLVQMAALQYTTPMKQSFLAATYVVFTPFVAWLMLRRRPIKKDLVVAVLALIGVGLISITDQFTIQTGDAMTLGFAVLFSMQIVLIEKLAQEMDSIVLTFYQFLAAGILSVITLAVTGVDLPPVQGSAALGLFYIVVINTALAICLQNYAQKLTTPSHAALLLSLESVFGFLISALIFRDVITVRMLLGCGVVLLAVVLSKLRRRG